MTVVNPKSISGINSITMASGSDNLLTIHTTNTTERVRINSSGDVIVGSGITVSPDGDIFTTGVTTATTFVGALTGNVTGNISGGTVAGSTGTFTGAVTLADGVANGLKIGNGQDLILQHNGTQTFIDNNTGNLTLQTTGSGEDINIESLDDVFIKVHNGENAIRCIGDGSVELYYDNNKKAETLNNGFSVTGSCYATNSGAGSGTSQIELQPYGTDAYLNVTASNSFYTRLGTSYTIRTQIDSSGNFHVNTGNLVIGTSGKGIDFSNAADDSTNLAETVDANVLDDYEEGSFTPAVQFDSGGGGISYGTRYGRYRKVGNMVHITYYMEISSGVSSSDYFARLSLPFSGFGGSVGHQDARIRQWNTGYSDWFVSLGGSAPVFFHSNANGSSSNYARGDDINGYKLSGQYVLYT